MAWLVDGAEDGGGVRNDDYRPVMKKLKKLFHFEHESNGLKVIFDGLPNRVDVHVTKHNVDFSYGVPWGRDDVERLVAALQSWLAKTDK